MYLLAQQGLSTQWAWQAMGTKTLGLMIIIFCSLRYTQVKRLDLEKSIDREGDHISLRKEIEADHSGGISKPYRVWWTRRGLEAHCGVQRT